MSICPNCGTEFSEDAPLCIDCREPQTGPEREAPKARESGESDFVVLGGYPSRIHAEMVGASLASAGIDWLIKSNEMFGSGTGLGTMAPARVEVWVMAEQFETARAIADGTLDSV